MTERVHKQRSNGVRYSSNPFPTCEGCPRLEQCPDALVSYITPCSFKAIYIRQVEMAAESGKSG